MQTRRTNAEKQAIYLAEAVELKCLRFLNRNAEGYQFRTDNRAGMCLSASKVLRRVLRREGYKVKLILCQGNFLCFNHVWVEAQISGRRWIFDLTSEQFNRFPPSVMQPYSEVPLYQRKQYDKGIDLNQRTFNHAGWKKIGQSLAEPDVRKLLRM